MRRTSMLIPILLLLAGVAVGVAYVVYGSATAAPHVRTAELPADAMAPVREQTAPDAPPQPAVVEQAAEPPDQDTNEKKAQKPEQPSELEKLRKRTSDILARYTKGEIDRDTRDKELLEATKAIKQEVARVSITVLGSVRDSRGNPAPYAVLYVREAGGTDAPSAPSVFANSDIHGEYTSTFLGSPPGPTKLVLYAKDRFSGIRSPEQTLSVKAGGRYAGVDFVIPKTPDLTGRILDQNMNPVAGARVIATSTASNKTREIEARSDTDGRFLFHGLGKGRYLINAGCIGYRFTGKPTVVAIGDDSADVDIQLRMNTATALKVKLTCTDQRPHGYFEVVLFTRDGRTTTSANADKQGVALIPDPPLDTTEIQIRMSGFDYSERIAVRVYEDGHSDAGEIALKWLHNKPRKTSVEDDPPDETNGSADFAQDPGRLKDAAQVATTRRR